MGILKVKLAYTLREYSPSCRWPQNRQWYWVIFPEAMALSPYCQNLVDYEDKLRCFDVLSRDVLCCLSLNRACIDTRTTCDNRHPSPRRRVHVFYETSAENSRTERKPSWRTRSWRLQATYVAAVVTVEAFSETRAAM